jgi:F420-dependent oxidoreductase-like protein
MKARTRDRSSATSGAGAKELTPVCSHTVRLGLQLNYDDPIAGVALAQEADRLGFHSVWTSEAYGADAVTPMAWIAATTKRIDIGSAIMQMPARSPAATATTVATLDILSGGRVLLGLGTSGPQVAEGWHGQAWGKPLTRTREYVEIVRAILRREEPLEHHGEHYDIPYSGADATGLGKPLKIIIHPLRSGVPIYLAAIGPKNVALAAEIADGWLPIFFSPERFAQVHGPSLAGAKPGFDIAPLVPVVLADDVQSCRDMLKPLLALYVGGMGARGQNFYTRLAQRYGYEAAAAEIQDLYLEGKKGEAAQAVPDALVDEIALVGDRARIADRLAAWRECGVTTMILQARQPEALQLLAELVL